MCQKVDSKYHKVFLSTCWQKMQPDVCPSGRLLLKLQEKQTDFSEWVKRKKGQRVGGWTHADTSSVHPHGQPPGLWVKGHTGAGRWRHRGRQEEKWTLCLYVCARFCYFGKTKLLFLHVALQQNVQFTCFLLQYCCFLEGSAWDL